MTRQSTLVAEVCDVKKFVRVALDNPEMGYRELGRRFGISNSQARRLMAESGHRDAWRAKREAAGIRRGEAE